MAYEGNPEPEVRSCQGVVSCAEKNARDVMRNTRAPAGGWTRRGWLSVAGTGLLGGALGEADAQAHNGGPASAQRATVPPLPLTEFEPKSMLHVDVTPIVRARFPVIDFHTHVSPRRRAQKPAVPPAELLRTMDAVNVQTMVNLTGGSGDDLVTTITNFDRPFPRRFVSMTEPAWTRAGEPGY